MTIGPANAQLQRRVLLALHREPATSVTELAQRVESLRPSVSRALHALQKRSMVTRGGRTWFLTQAGQEEVRRSNEVVMRQTISTTQAIAKIADRQRQLERFLDPGVMATIKEQQQQLAEVARLAALKVLPAMEAVRPVLPDPGTLASVQVATQALKSIQPRLGEMAEVSALARHAIDSLVMREAVEAINRALPDASVIASAKLATQAVEGLRSQLSQIADTSSLTQQLVNTSAMKEAMAAITHAQRLNLGWLENASWRLEVTRVGELLASNNVAISHMIADLGSIARMEASPAYEALAVHASRTARAYEAYLSASANSLGGEIITSSPLISTLSAKLVVPTQTTSTLVGSLRGMIAVGAAKEDGDEQPGPTIGYSDSLAATPVTELVSLLNGVGKRFGDKWRGAWQTLHSNNPDRLSQATHSGRELLMQLLEYLAPDECFSAEECVKWGTNGKPTRTMRVTRILDAGGKTDVTWAEAVATAFARTHDFLTKESHNRRETRYNEDQVGGLLLTLGGLIKFILSSERS